jgi:3-phytase
MMNTKYFRSLCLNAVAVSILMVVNYYPQTITPTLELNAPGLSDQDDMCIWINADDHSLSTVIASDKGSNTLFVYDLSGNVLQTIDVPGMPGNIDIRYNFLLSGIPTDIIGYNDRDNGDIVFYKVDRTTRQLSFVSDFSDGGMSGDNYGFCLYHSPYSGKFYAIASSNSTQMKQWELTDNGDETIGSVFKRTWDNGSGDITEGLVADDELGFLFAANEGEGIYKYDAEPDDPNPSGDLIAPTGSNGLTADVEGITIYYTASGNGYLIASSQGSNNFKVYERQEPHNFVKTFSVSGVGSTDGIDVTNLSLGSSFPLGLFLCHDGTGSPYVIRGCKWEDVQLDIDTTYWDPTPVELNTFEVNIIDGKAQLHWQTSSETNNLGFEIQRSKEENNFVKIGFVPGYGTSSERHTYYFIDDSNLLGKVAYRLKQIDHDGSTEYSNIVEVNFPSPIDFLLAQNYPNPFNPSTKITVRIPIRTKIKLTVYDLLGNKVKELASGEYQAGTYEFDFEASGLPSGIYIYQIKSQEFSEAKKMIYLK